MQPRVLLASPTSELPRYCEYYDSIDRLIYPPNPGKASIHSSSPAKNRNIIIKNTLANPEFTHIFFTDDDHVYQPDTIFRLLSREVDIVSGLYCMKYPPFPIIALNNPNENDMSAFINIQHVGPFELVEVPRVPAGCLLVTTDALRKMAKTIEEEYGASYKNVWFTLGHIQPDEWADDLWFCDRARDTGIKIHLDTGVRAGHITKCILTPEYDPVSKSWLIQHQINSDQGIAIKGTVAEAV